MIGDLPALVGKYRTKGILLDTNLLVLLFVGLLAPDRVRSFSRTKNHGFTENEFSLLGRIVFSTSAKVITTPHILTEASGFIRSEFYGEVQLAALQIIAQVIQAFKERRQESRNLVRTEYFYRFGLTDSAILDLPPKKYLVLSVDAKLVIALQKKGIDAVNFNHLRQLGWEQ
jgi:hypothetical protein